MKEDIQEQETSAVNETASTQETQGEKTVPLAEMQRRLDKAQEKHRDELSRLREEQEVKVKEALEKYKAETELTGKELEAYRQKEAEREKASLVEKIAELEKREEKRALTDEAIKTLSKKQLPVSDLVLRFVVKDTADKTLQAIDDLSELVSGIKQDYAKSRPPLVSGGFSEDRTSSVDDVFSKAKITGF